jgi:hypothetical protein
MPCQLDWLTSALIQNVDVCTMWLWCCYSLRLVQLYRQSTFTRNTDFAANKGMNGFRIPAAHIRCFFSSIPKAKGWLWVQDTQGHFQILSAVSQNTLISPMRKSRKIATRISQDSMRLKNSFGFFGFCSDKLAPFPQRCVTSTRG